MPDDNPELPSTELGRGKRSKKLTERKRQMEKRSASNAAAAEVASEQPQANDSDNFIFGDAEDYIPPTLTGNDQLDHERYEQDHVQHLLRKLAIWGGDDWRPAWEQGRVDLSDLEAAYESLLVGQPITPPAMHGKGKAKAQETGAGRSSVYPGITYEDLAPSSNKSNVTNKGHQPSTNSISADSNSKRTGHNNLDDDPDSDSPERLKRRRLFEAHLKMAPTNAQLHFPPLQRTDSSTIIDGAKIVCPQSRSDSNPQAPVPPNRLSGTAGPATRQQPSHVPSAPVSSATRRPPKSKSQSSGLKITAVGPTKSGGIQRSALSRANDNAAPRRVRISDPRETSAPGQTREQGGFYDGAVLVGTNGQQRVGVSTSLGQNKASQARKSNPNAPNNVQGPTEPSTGPNAERSVSAHHANTTTSANHHTNRSGANTTRTSNMHTTPPAHNRNTNENRKSNSRTSGSGASRGSNNTHPNRPGNAHPGRSSTRSEPRPFDIDREEAAANQLDNAQEVHADAVHADPH
ncbi:hypothetical protein FRC06_008042 [Ceratobasidium sp. 370]|nr:hypothetical protein FRC06_008042 [Ceratobasidium sp. 370]